MPTPIDVLLDPVAPAVTAIFAALVGWEADAVATPRPRVLRTTDPTA